MARRANRYKEKRAGVPVYKTGIYARISVDREKKKSESIEMQVEMLKEFIQWSNQNLDRECELMLYDVYSDFGKTGTNFERPGFERLMKDIREGQIQCVIVKDFSRFGRNYIETGDYLEKIFPFMKIRFISVCDHYDSFSPDAKNQELSMNIKNLINDSYAKDISAKERASKRVAQKKGDYVGGIAPYGYRIIEENGIHKLAIDRESAEIVRRIFVEYADGKTIQNIVDGLFEDGIHRVSDFRKYHHVHCQNNELLHQWGNSSIRAILNRHNYYGDLVQHKYESRFQKGEKWCNILSEEEWIITSNTHEPIVSKEIFQKVQARLKREKEARMIVGWDENDRAFYNVFYCGDCGRKMCTRKKDGYVSYYCQARYYRDERKCLKKSISENKLQKIVRSEIVRQFLLAGMKGEMLTAMCKEIFERKIEFIRKKIEQISIEEKRISRKTVDTFLQYKNGKLPLQFYLEAKEERSQWETFFVESKTGLEQNIKILRKKQKEEEKWLKTLLQIESTENLHQELVDELIEKIYLYGDGHLEIIFKLKGVSGHDR